MGGSPVQTRSGGLSLSEGRCYQGRPADSTLGLSHRGDLHFGQTAGRSTVPSSSRARGSHSCPHRQRAPSNWTIPSSGSRPLPLTIYKQYIPRVLTNPPYLDILTVDTDREDCHGCQRAAGSRNRSAIEGRSAWSGMVGALAVGRGQIYRHRTSASHCGRVASLLLPRLRIAGPAGFAHETASR